MLHLGSSLSFGGVCVWVCGGVWDRMCCLLFGIRQALFVCSLVGWVLFACLLCFPHGPHYYDVSSLFA